MLQVFLLQEDFNLRNRQQVKINLNIRQLSKK